MMMLIYYNGELLQYRQFSDVTYKRELLRLFKKLYGRNFSKCEIKYEPIPERKKAA